MIKKPFHIKIVIITIFLLTLVNCDSNNNDQIDYLSLIISICDSLYLQLENDNMPKNESEYKGLVNNIIRESYDIKERKNMTISDSHYYYNPTTEYYKITFTIYSNYPPIYIDSEMAAPLFMFSDEKECYQVMTNTLHTIKTNIRNEEYEKIQIDILNYFGYHESIIELLRIILNNDDIPGYIRRKCMPIFMHNFALKGHNNIVHNPIERGE